MVGGQAGGSVLPVPISRSRMVGEQAGTLGHVWPIANTVSFPLFVLSSSAGGRGWGIEEKEYPMAISTISLSGFIFLSPCMNVLRERCIEQAVCVN